MLQRWHLLRRYTSPTAFIHSWDSQTARRPFTIDQLRSAVRKAIKNKYRCGCVHRPTTKHRVTGGLEIAGREHDADLACDGGGGYSGLPDAPGVPSLPYLRGSDGDLIAAKAQGKAIIYCFWRASE